MKAFKFSSINNYTWIILLFSSLSTEVNAQTSTLVFNLPHGPYAVGFKSVNQYDYSRSFTKYNAVGEIVNELGVRPIQTSIWYPAIKGKNDQTILFEEYVYLMANEDCFQGFTKNAKSYAKNFMMWWYYTPEDRFNREINVRTNATKNAEPATGSFPVIVYAPGWFAPSFENSVLFEYLASYGYIIVSSPCMGYESRIMTFDLIGIDAQSHDIEFLISFMYNYPNSDINRLAVMGFSWGGISNVFVKMRNDKVKAVICLDGSIGGNRRYTENFKNFIYADSSKMDVPFIYLAEKDIDLPFKFYNSLEYSDAYLYTFNRLVHRNFTSNNIKFMDREIRKDIASQEEVNQDYELVCQYVLNFLNAYFKDDKESFNFLNNSPEQNGIPSYILTKHAKKSLEAPPSVGEFAQTLNKVGFNKASELYTKIKKDHPDFILNEYELWEWGDKLMFMNYIDKAIDIFKLYVELFPESAQAYRCLGFAYMKSGDKKLAIKNYEKSIELDPENTYAIIMLKKLKEK